jgi:hypothetical protein
MKRIVARVPRPPSVVAFAVLFLLAWPQVAGADEARLEILEEGGGSSVYALSRVEQIGFEGDTLVVTVRPHPHRHVERLEDPHPAPERGGVPLLRTDRYPLESIVRIDFHWEAPSGRLAGVESPEDTAVLVQALHLLQNQPNPFSPETRIEFDLPQSGPVELKVYAVSGRLVRTLVEGRRAAGSHSVRWDGRDDAGRKVSSGVYFYNLSANGISESRKMILLP